MPTREEGGGSDGEKGKGVGLEAPAFNSARENGPFRARDEIWIVYYDLRIAHTPRSVFRSASRAEPLAFRQGNTNGI